MLRRWSIFAGIWVMLCIHTYAMAALGPQETVDTVAKKLFETLKTRKVEFKEDPAKLRVFVEEQLMPSVDTSYAAYKVLGSFLSQTSKLQRTRFVKAFSNYLTFVYADVLAQYENEIYRIDKNASHVSGSNIARVFMYVNSSSGNPIKLEFLLRENTKKNQWLIYDLIAENVSLLTTKQAEFSPILINPKEGIDKLNDYLERYSSDRISGKESQEPWKNGSK